MKALLVLPRCHVPYPLLEDQAHPCPHLSCTSVLTLHLDAVLHAVLAVTKHEDNVAVSDEELPPMSHEELE